MLCSLLPAMALLTATLASCDDDTLDDAEVPYAPYVVPLGVTANGATTYYVVTTDNLMEGTVNAVGKGIEQNGYHAFDQVGETVFSIGGLGVVDVKGIRRGADGLIAEQGEYSFATTPAGFCRVDNNTVLALELPATAGAGQRMKFYTVDAASVSVKETLGLVPVAPLDSVPWPSVSGMEVSGGKVYVAYFPMSPATYDTPITDTTQVAVFDYPSMRFVKVMRDTRLGAAGSWHGFNAFVKDERGDLYVMSNSALSNGFSKGSKHSGFVRIKAGSTEFDPDYLFDFEQLTGGRKIAHVKYVGNGKVFAEVSTLVPQTPADRWGDKKNACYVIDIYNKTATEVKDIPVHNGMGGGRFVALVEGNYVYSTATAEDGRLYVYRTNMETARAERGARISATFAAGLFKLK